MRKLSKKISMLMVLAMLVSLFSGVVSASAASSWSFYNKTDDAIVEVKDSIEMESNQFADFDLYKDGKAFDTDVYTVKYESSDEDVVWVDAKNGKLRADKYGKAEAGDKAVVSAKIENKNTGAKTTKSFTIVIAEEEVEVEYAIVSDIADEAYLTGEKYALAAKVTADGEAVEAEVAFTVDGAAITEFAPAKAGEYTIVATATIDDEVVATEKFVVTVEEALPEIVSAKQTSLSTVEIKFNKAAWAKDFASKVKYTFFAGEVEVDDVVKSAAVKADAEDTVVITLYGVIAKDTVYKFAYTGYDCAATIKGAASEPAYIKVVGGKVPTMTEGKLDVKIYTADGIDITTDDLKANVSYTSTSTDCIVGNTIYFFATGKSAEVKAVYEMGWDNEGNEKKDLEAYGTYVSVDEYTYTNPNGFAISNQTGKADWLGYSNSARLSLSDTGLRVHAKYNQVKYDGTVTARYIVGGSDPELGRGGYTYSSTNESVILVDSTTGLLSPCSQGTASIIVYQNVNGNPVVVGSFTVKVEAARQLNSFSASIADRKLSTELTTADATVVTVNVKDQLGDGYNNNVNYKVELANPANQELSNYLDWSYKYDQHNNITGITLSVSDNAVNNIENKKIANLTVKITVSEKSASWVNKSYTVPVSVKNVDASELQSTVLNVSAASVDMKLNLAATDKYNVTAKLVKQDKDGFDLGLQNYTYITSEAAAVTENGIYSIIVKKNAEQGGTAADATTIISDDGTTVTFAPVYTKDGYVVKTGKDTYTIKVFKGNGTKAQVYATRTVSFTDSTSAITVVVDKNAADVTNAANLKAALKFYRNGAEITNKVEAVEFKYDGSGNNTSLITVGNKIYVKTISVTVSNKEMNNDFAGSHKEDVAVNALFTK